MNTTILVELKEFSKSFTINNHIELQAIDCLNVKISKGETFSLVGESGCGKTTCGRTLINAFPPSEGTVLYNGKDVSRMTYREKESLKQKVQVVFHTPYAFLPPQMTISDLLTTQLNLYFPAHSHEAQQNRINAILHLINVNPSYSDCYLDRLSVDQFQRVAIAYALVANPEFIVCDEPISTSNWSFQSQMLHVLKELQQDLELTYLFTSRNLSMVKHISDQIGIIYLGTLVELTTNDYLSSERIHPYTQTLHSTTQITTDLSKPVFDTHRPSQKNLSCCHFADKCPSAMPICQRKRPEMIEVELNHFIACHLYP